MDDRIRSVLDAAFPDREVERVETAEPSWNDKNETVSVEFAGDGGTGGDRTGGDGTPGGDRIYLKIATDGDASRVAREEALMQ